MSSKFELMIFFIIEKSMFTKSVAWLHKKLLQTFNTAKYYKSSKTIIITLYQASNFKNIEVFKIQNELKNDVSLV